MAATEKVNKSKIIRDYKAANPEAGPKAIAEALAEHDVNAQFVSTVLAQAKAKKKSATTPAKRAVSATPGGGCGRQRRSARRRSADAAHASCRAGACGRRFLAGCGSAGRAQNGADLVTARRCLNLDSKSRPVTAGT
jgi:hypothetical protein